MGRNRGLTLVELLVALAVVGTLLSFVYRIFLSQQRSFALQEEVADAQQNARLALEELSRALASLGVGVAAGQGQVSLLVAHPDQITFNADRSGDHNALAPGSPVPGAGPADPYPSVPGTYALSPAETYRYYLRADGSHHVLAREVNGGPGQQTALLMANPGLGEPLFRYHGDFDGDGVPETLDRVDLQTSPRLAAGEPLDALVRRIEIHVVTRTAHPDRRYPDHGGHRVTRFTTSVTLRNL